MFCKRKTFLIIFTFLLQSFSIGLFASGEADNIDPKNIKSESSSAQWQSVEVTDPNEEELSSLNLNGGDDNKFERVVKGAGNWFKNTFNRVKERISYAIEKWKHNKPIRLEKRRKRK